jgi:DNA-directed RNA polymerase specialized sigma24 family protein
MADATNTTRRKWRLTPEAFDALLAALDGDRARAGERYELLRKKLVRFFEWRGAAAAEEWADETLDRVGRHVAGGEQVRNVASYAAGVARLVWLEALKEQARARELDERTPAAESAGEDEETASRMACLEACLGALPDAQRALVLDYFADEKRAKIDHRKAIAARLGIEVNALRIRVHRIRARLGECVRRCVGGETDSGG